MRKRPDRREIKSEKELEKKKGRRDREFERDGMTQMKREREEQRMRNTDRYTYRQSKIEG